MRFSPKILVLELRLRLVEFVPLRLDSKPVSMRDIFFVALLLMFCPLLNAQQALNNETIIRMVKNGLSDDVIVSAINALPGIYDTSTDGLTAMRIAGVSDRVVALILVKSVAPAPIAPETTSPTPHPPRAELLMPLGLCEFRVHGSSKSGNAGVLVGALGALPAGAAVAASGHHQAYYRDVNKAAQQIYESTIEESGLYPIMKAETLVDSDGKKHLSLADTAAKNALFACVSSQPSWAAQEGKDTRAVVTTNWEVVRPDGCKVKFMTSASSSETYKKLPNGADPKLNSVYLGLSKQDATKFLEDFRGEMKKAGCMR